MKTPRLCALAFQILLLTFLTFSAVAFASEQTIFVFPADGSGGNLPAGGLISDAAGNLYGVTESGGTFDHGTVFKLSFENGAWSETVLYSFGAVPNDGAGPASALLFDGAGNLYGTTSGGGSTNNGTVFKLAPDGNGGWTESILHAFNGKDGSLPILSPLVSDAHGNLFGATQGYCYRGTCGNGSVFELSPKATGGWAFRVLHSFGHVSQPDAGVILDKAGNLYGTTVFGGPPTCSGTGCGTVFKLTHVAKTWTFTTIYTFDYTHGAYPMGNLIVDSAGSLYGTTNGGGSTWNGGVAFRLSPTKTGWKETMLKAFGAPGDGRQASSVVFGSSGHLFGAFEISTNQNDYQQNGYIFELSRQTGGTWSEGVVYAFPQSDSTTYPNSNLIWNNARTALYGTIGNGSAIAPVGAVYEVIP